MERTPIECCTDRIKGRECFSRGFFLTTPSHTDTIAIRIELADAALGAGGMTDPLAKGDEHVVDLVPVILREFLSQGEFCLLWGLCRDIAPTIGNTVHVGIHTDAWFLVPHGENKVGGFSSHALEFEDFIDFVRNATSVLVDQGLRDFENSPGFVAVESDRIDGLLYFFMGESDHFFGPLGKLE